MILTALLLLMLLAFPAGASIGATDEAGLKVGDQCPEFGLVGSDGKTHSLENHQGDRPIVIAWFPKAFTGG